MNENLFHHISFPENYVSINEAVQDLKNIINLKKMIPVYHSLFLVNDKNQLIIHPKFGNECEFAQLITLFPKFSICLLPNYYNKNINFDKYLKNLHSLFYQIDKNEILDLDLIKKPLFPTYFIFNEIIQNNEFENIITFLKKSDFYNNFTLIFPFYFLENANKIKKQINISKLTELHKLKMGFYPKEICQSFTDPKKYHLLFTLLSSLPFSLHLLNGQETLRNYPSALINQTNKETINRLPNQSFFNWLCETRDILQHYRNMIKKYRCPTLFLKKKVIWLEYKSLETEFCFKIGFNFEKLFIRLSQPKIYHIKTIWYNQDGAHIDQSGIKKHLAPFGIALMDNFSKYHI